MTFRFSLDPVLRVRKHQEKLQKQKLAGELVRKKEILAVRDDVQEKLKDYLQTSQKPDVSRIHDLQKHGTHMEQVHGRITKLTRDLDHAEENVSRERVKLAEAHKDRHMLEKVKEGEFDLFQKRLDRIEQKSQDEIATQMHRR